MLRLVERAIVVVEYVGIIAIVAVCIAAAFAPAAPIAFLSITAA